MQNSLIMKDNADNKQGPVQPELDAGNEPKGTISVMLPSQHQLAVQAGATLTTYGESPFELRMPEDMSEADYLAYGVNIGRAMEYAAWRIGDWVNFGVAKYKYKDYAKLAAVTNMSESYLMTCSSTAGRVGGLLREGMSLERARLIVARKGKSESVEHCFGRLKTKTSEQLRKLAAASGGGKKPTNDPTAGISMAELYENAKALLAGIQSLRPETLGVLAAYEREGKALEGLMNEIVTALTAMQDLPADTPAKK